MIKYSVSIDSDAEKEIGRIAHWLDCQSPGRGEKFLDQVQTEIDSLTKQPERHAIKYRNVRSMRVKVFTSFNIHYAINDHEKIITVKNLIDSRRGPHHHPRRS